MFEINYHNITTDDMLNGTGLRVVLWVSGCEHKCNECQNPQTWDKNSGIEFDLAAYSEIIEQLNFSYIDGLTLSGGDPLHPDNVHMITLLCKQIKNDYPSKTIWLYTGYNFESVYLKYKDTLLPYVDVVVDGEFIKELADTNYCWAGSSNQRVIDVKKTLANNEIVLLSC